MTFKVKSSPTVLDYIEKKHIFKKLFDKQFDKDLKKITNSINKIIRKQNYE